MMAKEAVEILAGVVIGTVKMLTPKSMALLRGLQTQEAKKKNGDFWWHLEHTVLNGGIHNTVVTTTPHDIISPLKFRLTFPMAVNNYYCSRWSCQFKEVIQVLKMYLDTYVFAPLLTRTVLQSWSILNCLVLKKTNCTSRCSVETARPWHSGCWKSYIMLEQYYPSTFITSSCPESQC